MTALKENTTDPLELDGDAEAVQVSRAPSAYEAGEAAANAMTDGETHHAKAVWSWIEAMRPARAEQRDQLDKDFSSGFCRAYKLRIEKCGQVVKDDGTNAARQALSRVRYFGRKLVDNPSCKNANDVFRLKLGTQTEADKKAKANNAVGKPVKLRDMFDSFIQALNELDLEHHTFKDEGAKNRYVKALAKLKQCMVDAVGWKSRA